MSLATWFARFVPPSRARHAEQPLVASETRPVAKRGALRSAVIAAWPTLAAQRRTAGIVMVAVHDARRRRDLPTDWRADLERRLGSELPQSAQLFRLPKGNGVAAFVPDTPALILGAAARRLSACDFPGRLAVAVAVAGCGNTRPHELVAASDRALEAALAGDGRIELSDLRIAGIPPVHTVAPPRQFA